MAITAKKEEGNCFEAAFKFVVDNAGPFGDELKIVHAVITANAGNPGARFTHAWAEVNGLVIDTSNMRERPYIAPIEVFYNNSKIDPKTIRRYTRLEAVKLALEHGHYGWWEDRKGDKGYRKGKLTTVELND